MAAVLYRALEKCRVGRLRLPGEVFLWEEFELTPDFLERAEESGGSGEEAAPPPAYPLPEDLEAADPGAQGKPAGKKALGRK
ncbi:MAG: hypothetical protein LBO77_05785 [Desulfovibrio sp.]|jgi:hypothetical protein|nr:hypothetical protein [Desulfovibrio sp.]